MTSMLPGGTTSMLAGGTGRTGGRCAAGSARGGTAAQVSGDYGDNHCSGLSAVRLREVHRETEEGP